MQVCFFLYIFYYKIQIASGTYWYRSMQHVFPSRWLCAILKFPLINCNMKNIQRTILWQGMACVFFP